MTHRGRLIDLAAIRRVALMTVEGEKDDITGIGQCAAAHEFCSGIPSHNKRHFECPGVGHYGIFNGSRFRSEIAPRIARFVRRHDTRSQNLHEFSHMDFEIASARANGQSYELAAAAFSFSAANDIMPDRMAKKLKSDGLGAVNLTDEEGVALDEGLHAAQFRLMALAGTLFLDGLFRLHLPLGHRGSNRSHLS
jgi:poly(3-hydroxybutyrate) depolymerase